MIPDWLRTSSLDTAIYMAREGRISETQWLEYAHLWQISAPRFSTRVCQCTECIENFPSPTFEPVRAFPSKGF